MLKAILKTANAEVLVWEGQAHFSTLANIYIVIFNEQPVYLPKQNHKKRI